MKPLEPRVLSGETVGLEPLTLAHIPGLATVAFDPDLWQWTTTQIATDDDLRAYVEEALALQRAGTALPFCIVSTETGEVIGSSRFGNYDPANRKVEIGWSWVGRRWQRTSANPEAKLLMLEYAFTELECLRVEFKTDALNARSRGALEKLGARQEGILRSHMITSTGRRRDSVYFSILTEEWPEVRRALVERLAALRPA
jgi:RimJ/RimL family protein N-acetyltransferase